MAPGTTQDFHRPRNLEKWLVIATFIVIAGHIVGSIWLYHMTDWFDNLLHLLGGAWLALAAAFFLRDKTSPIKILLLVFSATILWEIFEFGLNLYAKNAYGFVTPVGGATGDTILDIILGMLGATIAAFYIKTKSG